MLQYLPLEGIKTLYPTASISNPIEFTQNILIPALNEVSKYQAYKNPSVSPALRYTLSDVNIKTEYNPPPQTTPIFIPPLSPITFDYEAVFHKYDLCNYAKANNIKAVFIWAAGSGSYVGGSWESTITGSKGIPTNNGGYNLSSCPDKTIVVYIFNYERGLAEALETYGHHLESVLRKYRPEYGQWEDRDSCGNDHNPPNSRFEYDRSNPANFLSDCRNWKNDGSGTKETLSCSAWGCSGEGWLKWWMQNMPGLNHGLVSANGQKIPNWWVYIGDSDNCVNNPLGC